jgi:hypothetical protein
MVVAAALAASWGSGHLAGPEQPMSAPDFPLPSDPLGPLDLETILLAALAMDPSPGGVDAITRELLGAGARPDHLLAVTFRAVAGQARTQAVAEYLVLWRCLERCRSDRGCRDVLNAAALLGADAAAVRFALDRQGRKHLLEGWPEHPSIELAGRESFFRSWASTEPLMALAWLWFKAFPEGDGPAGVAPLPLEGGIVMGATGSGKSQSALSVMLHHAMRLAPIVI